jgi:hypothetical protein
MSDQSARRVGQERQSLGEIDARGKLGMGNEIDQNAVEQIDVIGSVFRGACEEQFGDSPCGFAQAFGIAISDDLIEPGDQRGSNGHRTYFFRQIPEGQSAVNGCRNFKPAAPGAFSAIPQFKLAW